MSDHRKYHGMYFILGFIIAAMLVMLLGCEQADTSAGVIIERPPPVYCCMALTPSCEACQEGIPEDVWLEKTCGIDATDAEYYGWDEDKNEPIWLCQSLIIN
jgi:hypothetical protein